MIKYKDGFKYQLDEDYEIQTDIIDYNIHSKYFALYPTGDLIIREGYAWDGASGAIDTKNFMRPSLVHDVFCQMINEGYLPQHEQIKADELLIELCQQNKMWGIRRWWVLTAVRFHMTRKKEFKSKPVLTAP